MDSWSLIYWILYIFCIYLVILAMFRMLQFIEAKLDINIFRVVEMYLWESNRPRLCSAVRTIAQLLTSESEKRKQYRSLIKLEDSERKENSILQRDLYLIEERDILHKQASCETLNPEETQNLEAVEEEMSSIRPRFWQAVQEGNALARHSSKGAWMRERELMTKDESWQLWARFCKSRGGCCDHACQCCKKPRRGLAGQKGRIHPDKTMHCTAECGCCIRMRGFYKLHGEEGEKR